MIDSLMADAADPSKARMTVDLPAQTVAATAGTGIAFAIAPEKKEQLLVGLDEISSTERLLDEITAFEQSADHCCPAIKL